jgi:transcriptional regulator with XRE-family HTH domain
VRLKDWQERQLARDPEYAKAIAEIDYAQRVADAIVGERVRLGLTQEELAARAGTTQARISEIERGVGNTTMDTLERVLAALRAAAPATDAATLLAAITTVKAEAFGFRPAVNGTVIVGTGTGFFASGVAINVAAPFVATGVVHVADLTEVFEGANVNSGGVTTAGAAANSNLALAA